jgi:hypothetical protein
VTPREIATLHEEIERYLGFYAEARPEANPLIEASLKLHQLPTEEPTTTDFHMQTWTTRYLDGTIVHGDYLTAREIGWAEEDRQVFDWSDFEEEI